MFATVRRYEGLSSPTVEALSERAADIGALLAAVPGVSSVQLIRTRGGVTLVTVGDTEASLVEAGRRFVAWVAAHVHGFGQRTEGDVWAGDLLIHASPGGSR